MSQSGSRNVDERERIVFGFVIIIIIIIIIIFRHNIT